MNKPQVFIGQEITVGYEKDRVVQKSPTCPDYFVWDHNTFVIKNVEQEWKDFSRKGNAQRNMRPAHLRRVVMKGSWGVGRFFFRVQTECSRNFEMYYDRAPHNRKNGQGVWILFCEYS